MNGTIVEERKVLIGLSRSAGMSDAQILRKIVTGVLGRDRRKELIVEWGEAMGLDANEAYAQLNGLA
jgi:hypothetical protein